MKLPNVTDRSIITLSKKGGTTQYMLTLPVEFAQPLLEKGIKKVIVAHGKIAMILPDDGSSNNFDELIRFFKAYKECFSK